MATTNSSAPAAQGIEGLGDFTTNSRRTALLSVWAVGVGVAAALIAVALLELIGFFTNVFFYGQFTFPALGSFPSPFGTSLGYLIIVVPVLGGLIVGFIARYGSERVRGHGIPEALEAILINRSRIEPKVTVLKPVATAVSIGSGGPFGAEGPIIMTGGAFGSVLGQLLRVSAQERKTLLVAGAAAGMAATFNTPLAALLIAVELLLFEWKPRSLIPVGVAVVVATIVRWPLLGNGPLFPIPTPLLAGVPSMSVLGLALMLGLIAGFVSALLTWMVYAAEDGFRKLPIHWMWWPAIGGIAIGVGGLLQPRALGVGYFDAINPLLLAELGGAVILSLLVVKAVIWAIALGSGTSGGVLAPLLIMGGALGGLIALAVPGSSPTLFVLVGMGAMIGGTMRAPFTGIVFSLELTNDFGALFPLLIAAIAADAVTVLLMKRSILTEKVARRGVHVTREYSIDPLERIPARSVMRTDLREVPSALPVEEALRATVGPDGREYGLVVLREDGTPSGILTRGDLTAHLVRHGSAQGPVGGLVRTPLVVGHPDEPTLLAMNRLAELEGDALPITDPSQASKFMGYVTREAPFDARVAWNELDQNRETMLRLPGSERARSWWRRHFGS